MHVRERRPQPDSQGFLAAVPAGAVQANHLTRFQANGLVVILTRLDGEVVAFSAHCPHAAGDLSKGRLYRGQIDCPEHGYRFDIRSGRPTWPEDEVCRLKRFPVIEEAGMIRVKLT